MELKRARGVRDFPPEKKILRNWITDVLRKNFEKHGFSPMETPIIERFDVLSAKYAGGEEILKETFRFKDQGDRDLALRYDLTVPMCRYVGMNPKIKMPFKRYQIERVFRDGPIKLGRYREFWQCDVDIVGTGSMLAETQLMEVADDSFRDLGLPVTIRINNRRLLNGIMVDSGIEDAETAILSIDKLEKLGKEGVKKELSEKGIEPEKTEKVFSYIDNDKIDDIELESEEGQEGKRELKELFKNLDKAGIEYEFDPSLARGLSYYTGTVYEVFLKDAKIKSATAAGGRYDRMIGDFIGTGHEYPGVGLSFGLEVLSDILEDKAEKISVTDAFIIPINTDCLSIARQLREKGINTDIDIMGRGVSKNLKYVNAHSIPFAIIIGEEEIKKGVVKLKNMREGSEETLSVEKAAERIRTS
ncbi:MAG: histidine--tRNA ligase [Nanobdellota archaeon]